MNLFDIAVIVVLILCFIRGILRGLIKETVSIIGVFLGFYVASKHHLALSKMMSAHILDTIYVEIFAFLTILFAVIPIAYVVEEIVNYLLNIKFFRWVDGLVGAGIGISKGILLVLVLFIIFMVYVPKSTSMIDSSRFSPYLEPLARKLTIFTPNSIKYAFEDKISGYRIGRKNHWKIPGSDNPHLSKEHDG